MAKPARKPLIRPVTCELQVAGRTHLSGEMSLAPADPFRAALQDNKFDLEVLGLL